MVYRKKAALYRKRFFFIEKVFFSVDYVKKIELHIVHR